MALRVTESAQREGFMGGPAKSAIRLDRDEGAGVFVGLWGSSRLEPMIVVSNKLGT